VPVSPCPRWCLAHRPCAPRLFPLPPPPNRSWWSVRVASPSARPSGGCPRCAGAQGGGARPCLGAPGMLAAWRRRRGLRQALAAGPRPCFTGALPPLTRPTRPPSPHPLTTPRPPDGRRPDQVLLRTREEGGGGWGGLGGLGGALGSVGARRVWDWSGPPRASAGGRADPSCRRTSCCVDRPPLSPPARPRLPPLPHPGVCGRLLQREPQGVPRPSRPRAPLAAGDRPNRALLTLAALCSLSTHPHQLAYGISLASPRLPCINVSKDSTKVVWLPMEMCRWGGVWAWMEVCSKVWELR
jgi:hypothetical protein